jgi:hypothetical protein
MYNPKFEECDCNSNFITFYNCYIDDTKIEIHFYDHELEYFIPKVCCNIVKKYIGTIPETILRPHKYHTLGHVFFDEGHKIGMDRLDIFCGICIIKRCMVHLSKQSDKYCDYHLYDAMNKKLN